MSLQTRYPLRPELRLVYTALWWRWFTLEGYAWLLTGAVCALGFGVAYVYRA